jgi:hypothetical protein
MSAEGGFCVNPEAVRSVAGDMTAKALQLYNVLGQFRALSVPQAWGNLGSPVQRAATVAHTQLGGALGTLLTAIQETINKVEEAARLYALFDREIAQAYGNGHQRTFDIALRNDPVSLPGGNGVPSFDDAAALHRWLGDSGNQAQMGVYEAYRTELGYPGGGAHVSLPDAARANDRVIYTAPDGTVVAGVVGTDRHIHTDGGVLRDIPAGSKLFVYRPIGATLR